MDAIAPIVLEGRAVRLEPLSLDHVDALCRVGLDAGLWQWTLDTIVTREQMHAYVAEALEARRAGTALPFVTIERGSAEVVGSTRFGNIEPAHRRLEIGWTWIGRPWQRTAVNTEAKLLMLRHAFEDLAMLRVELTTDALNARSRAAISRIGGREEGVLRRHMITASGRSRDTVYYSILAEEWPDVRTRLESRLHSRRDVAG